MIFIEYMQYFEYLCTEIQLKTVILWKRMNAK